MGDIVNVCARREKDGWADRKRNEARTRRRKNERGNYFRTFYKVKEGEDVVPWEYY